MASTRSGSTPGVAEPPSNGAAALTTGATLIDLDFVRALIAAVDGSGIDTLEISRGGTRVRISKSPIPAPVLSAAVAHSPNSGSSAATPAGTVPEEPAAPATIPGPVLAEVKSPMVGTFYRAPAPEAPSYVEVGSSVSRGQTLCILEAMKLMNELESEVDGIVREILVENADPVEYGQVLFRIQPVSTA
jgi:acetyl-CoA carboxylase biotin carboxyl carrier protein